MSVLRGCYGQWQLPASGGGPGVANAESPVPGLQSNGSGTAGFALLNVDGANGLDILLTNDTSHSLDVLLNDPGLGTANTSSTRLHRSDQYLPAWCRFVDVHRWL